MERITEIHPLRILWFGLILALLALIVSLSDCAVVFAAEESLEEQFPEFSETVIADSPESQPGQDTACSDTVAPADTDIEPEAENVPETVPEEISVTDAEEPEEAAPKEAAEAIPEETAEAVPEEAAEAVPEEAAEAVSEEAAEAVPEETAEAVPEETAEAIPEEAEETAEAVPVENQEAIPEEYPASAQEEPSEAAAETEPGETSETVSDGTPAVLSEETPEAAPEEESDTVQTAAIEEENISEETPLPEQTSDNTLTTDVNTSVYQTRAADAEESLSAAASGTIHIGSTSFNAEDEESSHWLEGRGWKNVAGQYIAMVDYDGREEEISTDEEVLTLAVAGVNRIKALKGDCSYRIIGTGIVLIDSIELSEGRFITLHPNTAIYEEGSAAVFLQQEDGSYLLINGDVAGILDEEYSLDDVRLVLPKDSCLKFSAMTVRTEVWTPEGAEIPVTEVTRYMTDVPQNAGRKTHENGTVSILNYAGKVIIKENSSITVEEGASVQFSEHWNYNDNYYGEKVQGELVIEGQLNVGGTVECGYIDIRDGGSLTGAGTVRSADIVLQPAGNLSQSTFLDSCTLTIYGNGNESRVSLKTRDSLISLKGSGIDISDFSVSGSCMLCIDTAESGSLDYRVGNITLSSGSHLDILANDHDYTYGNDWDGFPYRLLEDCYLEIYGKITGGPVNVLSGCVRYTGTGTDILPAVPEGFASRVLVLNGTGITAGEYPYPLNMTSAEAFARAAQDAIPVIGLTVMDTWPNDDGSIQARKWVAGTPLDFGSLSRENDKQINVPELLRKCGLLNEEGQILSSYHVAVEVIYSDFSRNLHFYGESYSLTTKNVIMFRILQCYWDGGAGGSAITHTSTAFTGNGILGGVGSSTVKAGTGSVVYGTAADPAEPDPVDPDPVDPDPVDPDPVDPDPVDPDPVDPDPVDPDPVDPDPVDPDPVDPDPVDPDPVDPDPVDPDPVDPDPADPDPTDPDAADSDTADPDSADPESADQELPQTQPADDGLVVTVSLLDLKEEGTPEDPDEMDRKIPQIWQLTIMKEGVPLTDLTGDPVKVVFKFTVPDDWGDPEEIAKEQLYAVFVDDEGKLTAYEAHYDPESGEIWFETEQTGYFVIVRFTYDEDELFTGSFYRALTDLEDVQDFLDALKKEKLLII